MRIRLKLELSQKHKNILPLSNRYETSAWIYKTLHQSDPKFASWLHDNGYKTKDGKACFKLFSFSDFYVPKKKMLGDRLLILSNFVILDVCFFIKEDGAKFIMGLFKERQGEIGDIVSSIKFKVAEVSNQELPTIEQSMNYKCLSPIVISKAISDGTKLRKKHIGPDDEEYISKIISNIKRKIETNNANIDSEMIEFKLSEKRFSNLITIAKGSKKETKVRGFKYHFNLTAPKEVHELICSAGIGELCSQGFGFVEVV